MILSILNLCIGIIAILIIAILISVWALVGRIDKLEKELKKVNADINSLHNNQNVLSSGHRDLYTSLRKHGKDIKREIRIHGRS